MTTKLKLIKVLENTDIMEILDDHHLDLDLDLDLEKRKLKRRRMKKGCSKC